MSEKSITDQIKHYQRDIDRCPQNSERMIRCIQRLCIIPVTVQHLQDTGIGRSVNSLRKYGGEAADAAKALVAKWKAMVAAEESSEVEDEPTTENPRNTISSPVLNQRSATDNEHRSASDSENKSLKENKSSTSHKSDTVHKTSSAYKTSSRHKSDSGNKSRSDNRHNSESRENINVSDKKSTSKHRESNGHRSSSDSKSRSENRNHSSSSSRKPSSSHRTVSNSHKSKSDSHSKDNERRSDSVKTKETEHKTKNSFEFSSKEREYKYSKDKSNFSSSKERKRPMQDSSDEESSSSVKRKRKKSTDDESVYKSNTKINKSSSKTKVEMKEESCEENENDSGSDINADELNQSSGAETDESRQSTEHSVSDDESNKHSDKSSEHSNDESNSSTSNKHINGHSSQTSDSESSSSNTSDQRYKNKKSSRHDRSEKSRSHTDDRKFHSNHKSSHKDKHNIEKRKTDHKKSSHSKEFPVKIKQERADETVIKKEKDVKTDDKNDRKNREHNVKSSSSKSSKSSESKNPIKENTLKSVKIEKAADGSIDCESGASFADALLGMSESFKKSPKKKSTSSLSKASSSHTTCKDTSSKSKTCSDTSDEPLLLKKNIKLEPLEVDLSATLPEITPHYRPLPRYSPPSSPIAKRSKTMTQEEALSSIMSTKNQRTKVFSGNKCSGMATVPTLFDFCIQVLRENIDALEYTGGVPFDVLKPVLDRATADQLYQLEHYNPYLVEDTDPLWQFHCNKEFRGKKREDLESWRDLFLRCLDEREQKLKALTANISQSMAKSTPVRQTKLAYVDSVVKPPRNIARKQAKFGTANSTKHEIVSKAVVGAHSSSSGQPIATDVVPPPPRSSASTSAHTFSQNNILKKKKAPLMAKALQLIKGNRYKR